VRRGCAALRLAPRSGEPLQADDGLRVLAGLDRTGEVGQRPRHDLDPLAGIGLGIDVAQSRGSR